jgi:hypothetical protein
MANITNILAAATALNLPVVGRGADRFELAVRAPDSAWAVVAEVATEAELRAAHDALRGLFTPDTMVTACQLWGWDQYFCRWHGYRELAL